MSEAIKEPRYAVSHLSQKLTSPLRAVTTSASIFGTSRRNFGTNIFEREWDLVLVLDSARYDILRELECEYSFLTNVNSIWSVGSTSPEWMANTFSETYRSQISDTAYITSNPHTETVLEKNLSERYQGHRKELTKIQRFGKFNIVQSENLGLYDPVWKQNSIEGRYEMYENYGDPRNVTDKAIQTLREYDFERVILHYMPPHIPLIVEAIREERDPLEYEQTPWKYIQKTGDQTLPLEAHKEMLRWVLDDIEVLLENVDAQKIAITADHGDAFGEFGTYGHPAGSLNPKVRRVPWVTTSAKDTKKHMPEYEENEQKDEKTTVDERLESLGYLAASPVLAKGNSR
ncbi:hypothetical protein [Halobaculum roseum]|uniref:Sulfatase N-terminal domain-containing protein n=1 Tax=Halobaculum roseum TaxID=2175149 RepID=A0ABD5MPD4_9EURY|nr:hypothetical protein [Halobaculum roseum]QZY03239.1 hypothetical protein K6T36_03395 [Halobaculum roseum]